MRFRDLTDPIVSFTKKFFNKIISFVTKSDLNKIYQQYAPLAAKIDDTQVTEWSGSTSRQMPAIAMFNKLYPQVSTLIDQWAENKQMRFSAECFKIFKSYYDSDPKTDLRLILHSEYSSEYAQQHDLTDENFAALASTWLMYKPVMNSNQEQVTRYDTSVVNIMINCQNIYNELGKNNEKFKVVLVGTFCHEYAHVLQHMGSLRVLFGRQEWVSINDVHNFLVRNLGDHHIVDARGSTVEYYGQKIEIHAHAAEAAIEIVFAVGRRRALEMVQARDPRLSQISDAYKTYVIHARNNSGIFSEFEREIVAQINQA